MQSTYRRHERARRSGGFDRSTLCRGPDACFLSAENLAQIAAAAYRRFCGESPRIPRSVKTRRARRVARAAPRSRYRPVTFPGMGSSGMATFSGFAGGDVPIEPGRRRDFSPSAPVVLAVNSRGHKEVQDGLASNPTGCPAGLCRGSCSRRPSRRSAFALDGLPRITETLRGTAGDPLNVALVGSQEQLVGRCWRRGGSPPTRSLSRVPSSSWRALPCTVPTKQPRLAISTCGSKEDLAFEQEVGKDASRRHHVRFWQAPQEWSGRPLWLGAATSDTKFGRATTTGYITHHIDANVDDDRGKRLHDLRPRQTAGLPARGRFPAKYDSRNGGGDPYHTDGTLLLGFLGAAGQSRSPRR